MLSELPFYEELNVVKADCTFRGNAVSYKVELVEKKDPLIQLETTKSSIKDLFNDFLDEKEGFKYQITIKVLLKKYKGTETDLVLINIFKKFCTELITGLMKVLVG